MGFRGKTALVTGGTGALGNTVVQHFFDAGANLALPVHSDRHLSPITERLVGSRLHAGVADVTSEGDVARFVSEVEQRFGGIDFLVNLAGGFAGGNLIEETSIDEWRDMMSMNLRSAFLMCRASLRTMRARKSGRIVNVAAMPALASGAKKGPYAISKRGVVTLTEILADEVRGSGITANAIAPSIILTEANKLSMPDADFKKWVTPGEIANLILYLCSDDARSINGNTIKIYGGM